MHCRSHFNAYKYLTNVTQVHDDSSYHRQARADTLPIAYDSQAIRNILGDTADAEYPIFRRGAAPDVDSDTVCSAVFAHHSATSGTVELYCAQNPKDTQPCAVLQF